MNQCRGGWRWSWRCARVIQTTGVLILENTMSLFHTQYLARGNYSTELAEISHVTLLGDSAWDSRGVFGISVWGPRYGVPLGSRRGGAKILKIFFSIFSFFSTGNGSWSFKLLICVKISPSFNLFWRSGSLTSERVFISRSLKMRKWLKYPDLRAYFHIY